MKKSSFIVTILLVIALCFAVSCPNGPQVSITGNDISKDAYVGVALVDFTFDIEVVNGAFTADAKDQTLTIKGLSQFDAAGTGEDAKAKATATITALGTADATTKKVTKATVTVSGFTAKVPTTGAKDLTFEIPAVKADGKKILEDTTTAVAIGGKKVSISVSNPTTDVTVSSTSEELSFKQTIKISSDNTATYTLVGAQWKQGSLPEISTKYGLTFTFAINASDSKKLSLTVTGTPDTAVEAGEDFSFDIKNSIEVLQGSSYVIPETLKAPLTIRIVGVTPTVRQILLHLTYHKKVFLGDKMGRLPAQQHLL